MARAKQPVSVDDIEFDALIDSEEGYEADVPEYPTEKGFSVSDTIVLKADTLNMTLYVTDTPVTRLYDFSAISTPQAPAPEKRRALFVG